MAVLLSLAVLPCAADQDDAEETVNAAASIDTEAPDENPDATGNSLPSYFDYKAEHKGKPDANDTIEIARADMSAKSKSVDYPAEFEGMYAVTIEQDNYVEYTFDVETGGMYNALIEYYPLPGKIGNIEITFEIDGELPFIEAETIALRRIWKDGEEFGESNRDSNDNERRPVQVEDPEWITEPLHDYYGVADDDYRFYLEPGPHTVRVTSFRESFALASLCFTNVEEPPSYEELKAEYEELGYKEPASKEPIRLQAENAYRKSHSIFAPNSDFTSPSTEPSDPSKIRMNTMGGENWCYTGQWISWELDVPEDGLYALSFKYRQEFVRGMKVRRSIHIRELSDSDTEPNGDFVIPCKELQEVEFPFCSEWKNMTVKDKDGEPLLIYFTKGRHEMKLTCTLGAISPSLEELQDAVFDMDDIYRKMIQVTGMNPDPYADYKLDKEIKSLKPTFNKLIKVFNEEAEKIEEINDVKGGDISFLYQISEQLDSLLKKPETIPRRIDAYKGYSSQLAAMLLTFREQPLILDAVMVAAPDAKLPSASKGFFSTVWFRTKAFYLSFFEDYNAVGDTSDSDNAITVWVSANDILTSGYSSGRDQMTVLKRLIDDKFTPEYGINVNMNLVDSQQTLRQTIMGGQGPDAALFVPDTFPMDLGARGALKDLSKYPGFDEAKQSFFDSAFVPYTMADRVYAMPETQLFLMMFYRKDIFEEVGIEPPDTWEEFYKITPKLQKLNYQLGIQENINMLSTLIMQHGGEFYKDDWSATELDKPEAIEAFTQWTDFYTKYSFQPYFDPFNRFRTGEMPIMLQEYMVYNQLTVAAPEIKNFWEMAPIPGVMDENGNINRAQVGRGTCSIMLDSCENEEDTFKFLQWWASPEIQAEFGNNIESAIGTVARYNTANKEAFEMLPWNKKEQAAILESWEELRNVPKVVGDYFTTRHINNAFRNVIYNYYNPRETLLRYNKDINNELSRKRIELGIGEVFEEYYANQGREGDK